LARWSQSSSCILRRMSNMLREVSSVSDCRRRVSSP
jgi:hypothetical protein